MSELEAFIQNSARGLYRWENPHQSWREVPNEKYQEGQPVKINPFPTADSKSMWPVYADFIEYVEDDYAKVRIPPKGESNIKTWFREEPGEYILHEGYLTPQ